ncbi:MAG: hypothetical protein KDF60_13255 [Calditrichaeota bacterium]|nr:hypothetical protein [Calditrichota bacterium]
MGPIEIFSNDQMTVYYHQDKKIIHHIMKKQVGGQPFYDAILAATDCLVQNGAKKWLSDDRLNPMLKPEDQKWAVDVWQPLILEAGWKYWSIILPDKMIGKMRMNMMAYQYSKMGVTVKTFNTPEQGLGWLTGDL